MAEIKHVSSTGDFFPSLDGVRGIAVIGVVAFHYAYFNPASEIQRYFLAISRTGFMGVPIFFVLSGFLISLTVIKAQDRFSIKSYALRRAAKIYPPFVLSLIIFSILSLAWRDSINLVPSAFAYIITIPNFTPGWDDINPVYWSLMVEIHFYIVFPILFFALRCCVKYPELYVAVILATVPAAIRLLTHLEEVTSTGDWFHNAQVFPKALDNFALGILFSHIYCNKVKYRHLIKCSHYLSVAGAALLIATFSFCAVLHYKTPIVDPLSDPNRTWMFEFFRYAPAVSTFLLLFVIYQPASSIFSQALSFKPLRYTGVISYEWFLFHYPPAQFIGYVIGRVDGDLTLYMARTAVPLILTFGLSSYVYHKFSAPILNLAKQKK